MSVTVSDKSRIAELLIALEKIKTSEIQIGIFGKDDSHILMIANVNEYGCTIRPKNAKRLSIPLNKEARKKSPRDFSNLFTLKTEDGHLYLVRNKGQDKLEFMYWLATEVHIPERAFIRGGFDENQNSLSSFATEQLRKVLTFQMSADEYLDLLGDYMVGVLQKYLTDLREPPNANVTKNTKGSSNPLIDTGRLRQAITYQIVKGKRR